MRQPESVARHSAILVVPCYNEAERLDVDAFRQHVERHAEHRFLFVNDGSTDETLSILQALQKAAPAQVLVQDCGSNLGKAEAVRQGMLAALDFQPQLVGFWDADLATPLEAIGQLASHFADPQVQLVLGSRVRMLGRRIERRTSRHYVGRAFATAASWALGIPVYDTQCGAKLFRVSPQVQTLFQHPFLANWTFDVELLARYLALTTPRSKRSYHREICEVPLECWRDVAGSKLRTWDFLKAAFELSRIFLVYRVRPANARRKILRPSVVGGVQLSAPHAFRTRRRTPHVPASPAGNDQALMRP